jgi:hypothetical protein
VCQDAREYTAHLVPFIADGLASGEAVMVAVIEEREAWLREGLGADASKVAFVDMARMGSNPARIIPAWRQFIDINCGYRRPARGIGEPMWAGRRPEEVLECQLHEALLNVAIEPDVPFWLVCPYSEAELPTAVITEVHRSHPALFKGTSHEGSVTYGGLTHVDKMFAAPLPPLAGDPKELVFTKENLRQAFATVTLTACNAGLWSNTAQDIATAVVLLGASSLARGADWGILRIWDQDDALVCELFDTTFVDDPLAGRRLTGSEDPLWEANQVCDLVQVRSTPAGTTVRLLTWK